MSEPNFWWVSQGQCYKRERAGGYIWAREASDKGQFRHYWSIVGKVQPGDTIFSYYKSAIVAVSTATSAARRATRPGGANPWHDPEVPGKLVDVAYVELPRSVPLSEFGTEFQRLLPGRHSPLTSDGTKGVEGYLFELPRETGLWLEERVAPHLQALREQAR